MAAQGMQFRSILRPFAAILAIGCQPAIAFAQAAVALEVELLEVHLGRGDDHLLLDSTLTVGEGADQFIVETTGGSDTRTAFDDFEIQGLYSRTLADDTALRFGVRRDLRAGSDLTHGAAGVVFEPLPGLGAEHFVFISQAGDLTGGGEMTMGVDLAPRLVLEPRLAVGWSAQDIAGEGLGSGFTDFEASVRLRHAVAENFDVYAGIVHERLLGSTRDMAMTAGDPSRVTRAVLGVGFGF